MRLDLVNRPFSSVLVVLSRPHSPAHPPHLRLLPHHRVSDTGGPDSGLLKGSGLFDGRLGTSEARLARPAPRSKTSSYSTYLLLRVASHRRIIYVRAAEHLLWRLSISAGIRGNLRRIHPSRLPVLLLGGHLAVAHRVI